METFRDQLIRFQKINYQRNLKHVKESLSYNPSLIQYEKEYLRCIQNYAEISSKSDLLKKIIGADLVYQGDYHTLRQSQSLTLRILKDIHEKRAVILLMEMFHAADQRHVDDYLGNKISENDLIRKIEYGRKWPFSWRSWSAIITFCKAHNIPIVGVNSETDQGLKSLRNRDKFAAKIIVKTLLKHPERLAYVIDGDFHISPNHLPKEVDYLLKLLDHPVRQVIIYQNAENLYWKLCKQGKEEADVLKINDTSYCVMNTLPANKLQSYLNWIEFSEEAYYPVHQEWETDGQGEHGITLHEMITTIAAILDLPIPPEILETLSVHYANDYQLVELIQSIKGVPGHMRRIREKIKKGEAFLLQYSASGRQAYLIFLPSSNINMAAEEASHFVHAVSQRPSTTKMTLFDRFYKNTITECLGFFGSKFINEKRRSHSEHSIRTLLSQIKRAEYQEKDPLIPQIAKYMLQHFHLERQTGDPEIFYKKFQKIYEKRSSIPIIFSTQLGYSLGNKLYYAVKKGRFPLPAIRDYFQRPLDDKREAFLAYLHISKELKEEKALNHY